MVRKVSEEIVDHRSTLLETLPLKREFFFCSCKPRKLLSLYQPSPFRGSKIRRDTRTLLGARAFNVPLPLFLRLKRPDKKSLPPSSVTVENFPGHDCQPEPHPSRYPGSGLAGRPRLTLQSHPAAKPERQSTSEYHA
jgi:hypothetical protein